MYEAVHYFDDDQEVQLPTEDYFSSDYYTDRMIEYIRSNHGDGQPFFAYVAYQAVHYPHQAPREYIDKYNGAYDGGWHELRRERLERQKELGIFSDDVAMAPQFTKTGIDDWKIPDWDALTEEEKKFNARKMQTYAGMVDNMDVNIGRILDYLEEIGEADNTLVIFLADNGADPNLTPFFPGWRPWYETHFPLTYMSDYEGDFSTMGQKGSFSWYGPGWAAHANTPNSGYKTFASEGGLRVPFIAHLPGRIPSGETSHSFGFVKDIVPTLLEVAAIEVPGTTYNGRTIHPPTGTSMWSVFTGQTTNVHDESEFVGYELAGSIAVFRGRYKLLLDLPPKGTGEWELYDMNADPAELNDLSDEMPDLVAEMIQAYADYEKENNVIPVPEGYNPLEQARINAERGVLH
jgi:arylsulfatase